MFLRLIPFRLKSIGALSASALSVASVPTSTLTMGETEKQSIRDEWGKIEGAFETVKGGVTTYVVTPSTDIYEKFKEAANTLPEGVKKANDIKDKYLSIGTTIKTLATSGYGALGENKRDKLEEYNYWAFKFAEIVTSLMKQTGTILTDSLAHSVKDMKGQGNSGLISIQKLLSMWQDTNSQQVLANILQLYNQKQDLIGQINGADVSEIMQILSSADADKVGPFLNQINTNISSAMSETTSITDKKELLKRIFLGKDHEKNIGNKAQEATNSISVIEDLDVIKDLVPQLKDVLKNLQPKQGEEAEGQA